MYIFSFNHKLVSLYVIVVTIHRSVKYEPILTAGVNGATLLLVGKRCAGRGKGSNLAAVGKLYKDGCDCCHVLHKPVQEFTLVVEICLPVDRHCLSVQFSC